MTHNDFVWSPEARAAMRWAAEHEDKTPRVTRERRDDPQHTPGHSESIDAGGYCNSLVDDGEGGADMCGFHTEERVHPWSPGAVVGRIMKMFDSDDYSDGAREGFVRMMDAVGRLASEALARSALTDEQVAYVLHEKGFGQYGGHTIFCEIGMRGGVPGCLSMFSPDTIREARSLLSDPIETLPGESTPQ